MCWIKPGMALCFTCSTGEEAKGVVVGLSPKFPCFDTLWTLHTYSMKQ